MPERYEIKGKIARGGIGAIYRAYDTVMGREVAIKRLLPLEQTHLNEAADESLQREAAALARFQHPNIVTIFAFDEDADGPYVVMEMVTGETLKETVEKAAFPVEDFIELTLQMLDPLIAARDLNLLHRDIKPSNIMLSWLATGKFQIKVLDFGLAKFSQAPSTQTLDQTGSFLGSIDYLAPEQLELEPLDQRTDLYSLGCVLYFCLTQSPPFEGENAPKTMRNHLTHKVTPIRELRPDLPGPVGDWLMRMISRYPNQRPADARAALEELQAARRGESPISKGSGSGDSDGEIPTAIAINEAPSASSTKPETPAAKDDSRPTGPTGPRRQGSGPVLRPHRHSSQPIRKNTQPQLVTGPVKGKTRTQPQLNVSKSASGPVRAKRGDTGPRTGPNKPKPGAYEPKESSVPGKSIAIGAGIVILLVLLAIMVMNGRRSSEESGAKKTTSNSPAPAKTTQSGGSSPQPALPMPRITNPDLDNPATPVPEVTEGLVAHYSAADAVTGPDFFEPAQQGERVTWWGNLVQEAAGDHLLSVESSHREKGPSLGIATPSKHPELARGVAVLDFSPNTRLSARGRNEIAERLSGTEMTSIAVIRTTGEKGGVLRFEADQIGGVLNWDAHPEGYLWRMNKGSLRPTMVAKVGTLRERFLVVSHVWSGEKVEQTAWLSFPGDFHVLAAAGDAPFKETPIHRYSIGGIAQEPGAPTFQGQIAEWLIYDRALEDEERETVAGALAERYLDEKETVIDFISPSRNGQIPPPRNPETNAATEAPAPPVSAALAAHYAASDFTFGNDLRHGARIGQRVMAWANLADGSNADHLLAYAEGRPDLAPILAETDAGSLNGNHRVLRFSFSETLVARGGGQISAKLSPDALTCFLVVRPDAELAPVLRLQSPELDPAAGISLSARGFSGIIREDKAWKGAGITAPKQSFAIVSLVWDAKKGTHQAFARTPDGKAVASKPVKTSVKSHAFNGYKLGHIPSGRGDTNLFKGDVAEMILYGAALSDRDRKEVEDHLFQRYFAK